MKNSQLSLLDYDAGADKVAGTRDQAGASGISQAGGGVAVPCPAGPSKSIPAKMFFCQACLEDRLSSQQSSLDPRYCEDCQRFLEEQACFGSNV